MHTRLGTLFLLAGLMTMMPAPHTHSSAAATGPEPVAATIDSETVAIVSDVTGINLVDGVAVPVRTVDDLADLESVLSYGDPNRVFASNVVAAVEQVPPDRLALVGLVHTGCTPPEKAGVRVEPDGEIRLFAPDPLHDEIECFVAVDAVAVVSVDPDDVPLGSTDSADLVRFEEIGTGGDHRAVELTTERGELADILPRDVPVPLLPPLEPGKRRFAFIRPGCAETTAELLVTRRFVDIRLYDEPVDRIIDCAQAVWFLVVFDAPMLLVPIDAAVGADPAAG